MSKSKKPDFKKNKKLILERVEEELNSGFDFVQHNLKKSFGRIIGGLLSRVAKEVFEWAKRKGAMERAKKGFGYVIDVAKESKDKDLKAVAEKRAEGYLKLHEIALRSPKGHPRRKDLENAIKNEFLARLKIYTPIVHSTGDTYEELVRNVYPEKKTLEKLVREQFLATEGVFKIVEENPEIARIPSSIKSPILKLMRSSLKFMNEKIMKDLDKIYS